MEIKNLFTPACHQEVCEEIKNYVSHNDILKQYLKIDGAEYEAQLVFEPFVILARLKLHKYKVEVYVKYENALGGTSYFKLSKNNLTPSLLKLLEKSLKEFEIQIAQDSSGELALKSLKILNSKIKMNLNTTSALLK
jgi:hypothetical protein